MSDQCSGSTPVHQHRTDTGIVVLRPLGALDEALADDLRELCLEAHAPVVIDLEGCLRVETGGFHKLVDDWALYRPKMCVVCSDPGDVRMLETTSLRFPLPLFATVDQAVAALPEKGLGWPPQAQRMGARSGRAAGDI